MECLNCGVSLGDGIGLCADCRTVRSITEEHRVIEERRFIEEARDGAHFGSGVLDYFEVLSEKRWLGPVCIVIFLLLTLHFAGLGFVWGFQFRLPPGITVTEEPLQSAVSGVPPWQHRGFTFTPLARYRIRTRIVMRTRFALDAESAISPYDLVLSWGVMSDTSALKKVSFKHGYRFVFWSSENPPFSWDVITSHLANLHVIPKNAQVQAEIASLATDDLVTLTGYLVSVTRADGWNWTSSLSRTDLGGGACEVMWIEKVERAAR